MQYIYIIQTWTFDYLCHGYSLDFNCEFRTFTAVILLIIKVTIMFPTLQITIPNTCNTQRVSSIEICALRKQVRCPV